MSIPIQVNLLSDDDEDDNNFNNSLIITTPPISNPPKRLKTTDIPQQNPNPTPFLIIDDDPTPEKLQKSTPSVVPETPLSDLLKLQAPPVYKEASIPSFGSSFSGSGPKSSDVGGLIFLESDDEEGNLGKSNRLGTAGRCASLYEDINLEKIRKQRENEGTSADLVLENCIGECSRIHDSTFSVDKAVESTVHDVADFGLGKETWLNNEEGPFDYDYDSEKSRAFVAEECKWGSRTINVDSDVECLEKSPRVVPSTCRFGDLKSTKRGDHIYPDDDIDQILHFHDRFSGKENVRLEEDTISKPKDKGKANAKKLNKEEQAANRKKSQEEKSRLMEEKKLKKEQEKLHKAALKAEAAKSKQLQKDKQRWEKEADKNILAEIDTKVVQLGSIGGHLLTRLGEKSLRFNIASNRIEKSIFWRLTVPEELSELSSMPTDIPYILLVYDAEEFCKVAADGSIFDQISSVRTQYPSYTICCLTNRLKSYINKREQDKYKNRKNASDWQRPPVEEVFAKLTIHFANVHTRQCADEAELAEHIVGLTINLAKCRFRKKLSPLSVSANGCNIPKDCVDRDRILKNTWLKALVSIPKVQPRFAITIYKKYPTMKSLLSAYMDPTKSVHEKEFLLKDLTVEGLIGNENRRLGEICSKRVYRILMAQNGSIKTDDVEHGADYFTSQ